MKLSYKIVPFLNLNKGQPALIAIGYFIFIFLIWRWTFARNLQRPF